MDVEKPFWLKALKLRHFLLQPVRRIFMVRNDGSTPTFRELAAQPEGNHQRVSSKTEREVAPGTSKIEVTSRTEE